MTTPFRRTFTDMILVMTVIDKTIEDWQNSQRQKLGLSNFGMFSRAGAASKEEMLYEVEQQKNKL